MREKILELRAQGLSYNQIVKALGCAKSTVAYHLGDGQKEKTISRTKKLRKENALVRKTEYFKMQGVAQKMQSFHVIGKRGIKEITREDYNFNVEDVRNKIGADPFCYLTGRKIDLTDSQSYHFDHRVPRSKGGVNTLENLEIACAEANYAKHNMNYEDFVQLCREVVDHYDKKKLKELI